MAADTPDQNLSQYFTVCNDFIHAARLREGNVLIHCLAGMSRSVTVAVAYIMTATNLNWKEALKVVRAGRAVANPNMGFQSQLQEFEMFRLAEERRRLRERFPSTALEQLDRSKCVAALDNYQELLQNKDICEGNCSRGEKCPTGGCTTMIYLVSVQVGESAKPFILVVDAFTVLEVLEISRPSIQSAPIFIINVWSYDAIERRSFFIRYNSLIKIDKQTSMGRVGHVQASAFNRVLRGTKPRKLLDFCEIVTLMKNDPRLSAFSIVARSGVTAQIPSMHIEELDPYDENGIREFLKPKKKQFSPVDINFIQETESPKPLLIGGETQICKTTMSAFLGVATPNLRMHIKVLDQNYKNAIQKFFYPQKMQISPVDFQFIRQTESPKPLVMDGGTQICKNIINIFHTTDKTRMIAAICKFIELPFEPFSQHFPKLQTKSLYSLTNVRQCHSTSTVEKRSALETYITIIPRAFPFITRIPQYRMLGKKKERDCNSHVKIVRSLPSIQSQPQCNPSTEEPHKPNNETLQMQQNSTSTKDERDNENANNRTATETTCTNKMQAEFNEKSKFSRKTSVVTNVDCNEMKSDKTASMDSCETRKFSIDDFDRTKLPPRQRTCLPVMIGGGMRMVNSKSHLAMPHKCWHRSNTMANYTIQSSMKPEHETLTACKQFLRKSNIFDRKSTKIPSLISKFTSKTCARDVGRTSLQNTTLGNLRKSEVNTCSIEPAPTDLLKKCTIEDRKVPKQGNGGSLKKTKFEINSIKQNNKTTTLKSSYAQNTSRQNGNIRKTIDAPKISLENSQNTQSKPRNVSMLGIAQKKSVREIDSGDFLQKSTQDMSPNSRIPKNAESPSKTINKRTSQTLKKDIAHPHPKKSPLEMSASKSESVRDPHKPTVVLWQRPNNNSTARTSGSASPKPIVAQKKLKYPVASEPSGAASPKPIVAQKNFKYPVASGPSGAASPKSMVAQKKLKYPVASGSSSAASPKPMVAQKTFNSPVASGSGIGPKQKTRTSTVELWRREKTSADGKLRQNSSLNLYKSDSTIDLSDDDHEQAPQVISSNVSQTVKENEIIDSIGMNSPPNQASTSAQLQPEDDTSEKATTTEAASASDDSANDSASPTAEPVEAVHDLVVIGSTHRCCCRKESAGISYTLSFAMDQWKKPRAGGASSSRKPDAGAATTSRGTEEKNDDDGGVQIMNNVIYFCPAADHICDACWFTGDNK